MRPFRMRSLLDSLLFLGIATALNYAWLINNPAFRDWPWHPYLMIIALIGLFYGFWESLACLCLCALFYTTQLTVLGMPLEAIFAGQDARNLFAFLLASLFFGETGELYRRNIEMSRERALAAEAAKNKTADENQSLWEVNRELQERVRFMESHLTTLRETSDRLQSLDERNVLDGALEFLMKMTGAEGVSLYLLDGKNNAFWRQASIGKSPEPANPVSVPADAFPFNRLMQKPAVYSVREKPDRAGGGSALRWMAAMPLLRRGMPEGVFFVETMPLLRLTEQLLQDMEAVSEVVNRCVANAQVFQAKTESAPAGGVLVSGDLFRDLVDKELMRTRRHKSAASLLSFRINGYEGLRERMGEDVARFILDRVIQIAGRNKRQTDVLCHLGAGQFSMLMPHTSPDQIHPFIYRTREETAQLPLDGSSEERVGLSFGVYGLDEKTSDAVDVIQGAERMLKESFEGGNN